jgi:hypothetical protein
MTLALTMNLTMSTLMTLTMIVALIVSPTGVQMPEVIIPGDRTTIVRIGLKFK